MDVLREFVTERHRLGVLKVGKARRRSPDVLRRLLDECEFQVDHLARNHLHLMPEVHSKIG